MAPEFLNIVLDLALMDIGIHKAGQDNWLKTASMPVSFLLGLGDWTCDLSWRSDIARASCF